MAHEESPKVLEPEYYQRLHDLEETHWWSRGMRRAMFSLLEIPLAGRKHLRILDVGCGTGYLLTVLDDLAARDRTVGLDVSVHALGFCRQRGVTRVLAASATELPLPDSSYDLVVCIDTIQHLAPRGADSRALSEFARVLAPGGILYLRTNSALGHRRLQGVDPNLYRRYRRKELCQLVAEVGLEVERSTYLNFIPSLWAALKEVSDPSVGKVPVSGPTLTIMPPAPDSSWVDELKLSLLRCEALWLGSKRWNLPFGHSLAVVARRRQQKTRSP